MNDIVKWSYKTLDELQTDMDEHGVQFGVTEDFSPLKAPITVGGIKLRNSMAVHPMEGNDSLPDGSPGELAFERYRRYAVGGAGMIWCEAISCVEEGRSCPSQQWITERNVSKFRELIDTTIETYNSRFGAVPLLVAQLTHSGRYSKPHGPQSPLIAQRDPYTDDVHRFCKEIIPVSDEYLSRLEDKFADAAVLMKEAGFHAIDIKACHRYLISELLGAYERPGIYGGSFENRTRFLMNVVRKIRQKAGTGIILATRINIFDHTPYPHGYGVSRDDVQVPDYAEPIKLLRMLKDEGVQLASLSMGNVKTWPLIGRLNGFPPLIHPLKNAERLINGIGAVSQAIPDLCVVGVGYGYFRQYAPNVAAAVIADKKAQIAGLGRMSYACPEIFDDIMADRPIDKKKICVTCNKCVELLKSGDPTGCVVRNPLYLSVYKKMKERLG